MTKDQWKKHQAKNNPRWIPRDQWIRLKRLQEFVESKTGIQLANEDPNLFKQLCREIECPNFKKYIPTKSNLK